MNVRSATENAGSCVWAFVDPEGEAVFQDPGIVPKGVLKRYVLDEITCEEALAIAPPKILSSASQDSQWSRHVYAVKILETYRLLKETLEEIDHMISTVSTRDFEAILATRPRREPSYRP